MHVAVTHLEWKKSKYKKVVATGKAVVKKV